MEAVILVVHLIIALALIAVVLLQRSEGGALGIGGGGGGGSLFTARGVGNALTRATAYLAVAFFVTSIALTYISTHREGASVFERVSVPAGENQQGAPSSGEGSALPQLTPQAPATPQVPVSQ